MALEKCKRGFASMTPERRRELAVLGGKAAHAEGTAHQWTSEEATLAGAKGGATVSKNKLHMAEIGRKGGRAKAKAIEARKAQRG